MNLFFFSSHSGVEAIACLTEWMCVDRISNYCVKQICITNKWANPLGPCIIWDMCIKSFLDALSISHFIYIFNRKGWRLTYKHCTHPSLLANVHAMALQRWMDTLVDSTTLFVDMGYEATVNARNTNWNSNCKSLICLTSKVCHVMSKEWSEDFSALRRVDVFVNLLSHVCYMLIILYISHFYFPIVAKQQPDPFYVTYRSCNIIRSSKISQVSFT